jgi:hypothetical protein
MATHHDKLAASLLVLKSIQDQGVRAVQATRFKELTRVHRERLQKAGFLKPVISGWYLLSRPEQTDGDTTFWYASMERFIAAYAGSRFGREWQLNAEQSLLQHSGETTLSQQFQIHAPAASNDVVQLPHQCSLFLYRIAKRMLAPDARESASGLRIIPLEDCLFRVGPAFFELHPQAAQIAFRRADVNALARLVLRDGSTTIAGRFVGALQAVGRENDAQLLQSVMKATGHALRISNPFAVPLRAIAGDRMESPYVQRIRLMWSEMREPVLVEFEGVPNSQPKDIDSVMADVHSRYLADAYNSLSIEGYRVTAELIEKVRLGAWMPDLNDADRQMRDALAAKGYHEAHKRVLSLIRDTLGASLNPAEQLSKKLPQWHMALFSSSVSAGIVAAVDLAGYRNRPVFIAGSRHVPSPAEALRDCVALLMELLQGEPSAAVRAVLGHFIFVFIHPYFDGNGRLGRFIMNYMLTTAGYVWTVVPVQQRAQYMAALDEASTCRTIQPFARMLARLITEQTTTPLRREPSAPP